MNPTPEEIAQAAKESAGMPSVKTITDLRFDKLEKQLAEMKAGYEKTIAELVQANKELYALAAGATSTAEPLTAPAGAPPQPVAAAPVGQPDAAQIAAMQKAKDDAMLAGVIADMGYKRPEPKTDTTTIKDGM